MILEFFILDYCIGLFESFIFFKLMKFRLPLKNSRHEWPGIFFLSATIFMKSILNELGVSQGVLMVGLIVATVGIGEFFFKGPLKIKIANVLIFHIIMVATEIIAISPMLQIPGITLEKIISWGNIRIIGSMASKLLAYLVVTSIGRFGKKNRDQVATGDLLLEGLALLLLVVGMSLIIYPFVTVNDALFSFNEQWPGVIGIAFMIISITSVWVYEKLFERSQKTFLLRIENNLLNEQTKYYQKIDEMIQHYQQLQHDVNKHMAMVSHFTEEGDYEMLKRYTKEWQETSKPEEEVVITQSKALSGLLTHYKSLATSKGIELRLETKLNSLLTIPDTSLCIVVGNILENALEAVQKLAVDKDRPYDIHLRLETNGAYLIMACENPHGERLKKRGQNYISTKREGAQSGLGIGNVRRIVEAYEGELKIESDDQTFKVSLMMLNPKA